MKSAILLNDNEILALRRGKRLEILLPGGNSVVLLIEKTGKPAAKEEPTPTRRRSPQGSWQNLPGAEISNSKAAGTTWGVLSKRYNASVSTLRRAVIEANKGKGAAK